MNADTAQQTLDHAQALYRRWLELLPRLEAAQREWQQAEAVMTELDAFYARDYLPLRDAEAAGLPLSLHTAGEYSVLSEDAIFDALGDRHRLAGHRRARSAKPGRSRRAARVAGKTRQKAA